METIKKWMLMLACAFLITAAATNKASAQPGVSVSFNVFYDNLAPYGDWIQDPNYGYVWAPNVGSGFRPYYSNGYWVMTDYGNTWVSSYPWGWAPFHYGRWTYDPYYGWIWIPDNVWGPAWVSWRSSGAYYGWAPMGPGISVSMSFGSYYPPNDWWVFLPPNHIHYHDFYRYCAPQRNNVTIINNTTVINNTYINSGNTYVTGPRRADIERTTKQRVNVYNVTNTGRPGATTVGGNQVGLFRPAVAANGRTKAAPAKFQKADRNITSKPQPMGSGGPQRNMQNRSTVNSVQPGIKGQIQEKKTQDQKQAPIFRNEGSGRTPVTQQRPQNGKLAPVIKEKQQNNTPPMQQRRAEPTQQRPQNDKLAPVIREKQQNNAPPMQQRRAEPQQRSNDGLAPIIRERKEQNAQPMPQRRAEPPRQMEQPMQQRMQQRQARPMQQQPRMMERPAPQMQHPGGGGGGNNSRNRGG